MSRVSFWNQRTAVIIGLVGCLAALVLIAGWSGSQAAASGSLTTVPRPASAPAICSLSTPCPVGLEYVTKSYFPYWSCESRRNDRLKEGLVDCNRDACRQDGIRRGVFSYMAAGGDMAIAVIPPSAAPGSVMANIGERFGNWAPAAMQEITNIDLDCGIGDTAWIDASKAVDKSLKGRGLSIRLTFSVGGFKPSKSTVTELLYKMADRVQIAGTVGVGSWRLKTSVSARGSVEGTFYKK